MWCETIGGPAGDHGDRDGSDCHAARDGMVSVTPLDLDLTHQGLLEQLPGWRLDGFAATVAKDLDAKEGV